MNKAEEFEEVFGNVPIKSIGTIKTYIKDNYVSKKIIKEKINLMQKSIDTLDYSDESNLVNSCVCDTETVIGFLKELLKEE